MGLSDRDYYREDDRNFALQADSQSWVVKLIVINVALYLADIFFGGRTHVVTRTLSLNSTSLLEPLEWWKFLTYGFAHSYESPMHLIGNMLALFILGPAVEEHYGRKRFLRIYLTSIVCGGLTWGVHQYLQMPSGESSAVLNLVTLPSQLLGASGATTTITILFALNFPRRMLLFFFVLPMPAWVLGVLTILSDLLGWSGPGVAYDVHLAGAAFAVLHFYLLGASHGSSRGRRPRTFSLKKLFESPPQLRVHRPESDEEGDDSESDFESEADRILAKIHSDGEESLSTRERRIMEEYSRRMRRKHTPR